MWCGSSFSRRGRGEDVLLQKYFYHPCECSDMGYQKKVRQVCRIQSLLSILRKYTGTLPSHLNTQCQRERDCIRKASGYSPDFEQWILRWPECAWIPKHCPDVEYLTILYRIAKFDCDADGIVRMHHRKQVRYFRVQMDETKAFYVPVGLPGQRSARSFQNVRLKLHCSVLPKRVSFVLGCKMLKISFCVQTAELMITC